MVLFRRWGYSEDIAVKVLIVLHVNACPEVSGASPVEWFLSANQGGFQWQKPNQWLRIKDRVDQPWPFQATPD